MSVQKYKAFIRFFGLDGKKYASTIEDGYLIACRRKAKQYVMKAVEDGKYDGGFILVRYPSMGGFEQFVEVEQWAFATIEKEGFIMPKIWRSDIETVRKMEKGEDAQSEVKDGSN